MKTLIAVLGLATAALAASANAQAVNRITNPPPAIILSGAIVPPGAEIFHLSGQLASPIDPSKPVTGPESFGDTKTQTISIFNKIKAILEKQGYKMSDVFKLTVFVAAAPNMGGKMDFTGFNDGYKQFFGTAENPNLVARSTVQVAGLAGPNFLIEIEATAAKVK
ncbi:RidA family protein [Polymorphobacter fuscus]|uniref:Endonuclease n=1 Tax=Sandarakinorhabdus fusca TaxID=1439888 RepID=A0A7C9GPV2_9SPHN|nr:RidA family protein [Polymorphobacter fuscus]KAB7647868.1 endonuclease [Polymorphobacter fuscus]MQT17176.1 endonuclease [Polymorphobacter fuscus]NJC08830.1 enamine deaminase RidA (YjgF/YER057c/UK114 family) [Polymorphobacter fuscus]